MPADSIKPVARGLRFAGKTGIALFCAAAVALIGSRINRPTPFEILSAQPQPGDEVLSEVTLDMHSLRTAVASIQKSAQSTIVVEPDALAHDDITAIVDPEPQPTLPLHNVRLATVLSIAMQHFRQTSGRREFHQENGAIILCAPGKANRPVYRRIYDVRDLAASSCSVPVSTRPFTWSGTFASQSSSPLSADELLKQTLQMSGGSEWQPWSDGWDLQLWSGYLIANATSDGHRTLEELLLALRQTVAQRTDRRPR